jgi:hypothetical protein
MKTLLIIMMILVVTNLNFTHYFHRLSQNKSKKGAVCDYLKSYLSPCP